MKISNNFTSVFLYPNRNNKTNVYSSNNIDRVSFQAGSRGFKPVIKQSKLQSASRKRHIDNALSAELDFNTQKNVQGIFAKIDEIKKFLKNIHIMYKLQE